jgi:hypothetical protein
MPFRVQFQHSKPKLNQPSRSDQKHFVERGASSLASGRGILLTTWGEIARTEAIHIVGLGVLLLFRSHRHIDLEGQFSREYSKRESGLNELPQGVAIDAVERPEVLVLLNVVDRGDTDLPNPTARVRINHPLAGFASPENPSHFAIQPLIVCSHRASDNLFRVDLTPEVDAVFQKLGGIIAVSR